MGLDKGELKKNGYFVTFDSLTKQPIIKRYYKSKITGKIIEHEIKQYHSTTKHPYGSDKTYKKATLTLNGKRFSYTVGRIAYAFFYGSIPAKCDIDHIDNDPDNNAIANLKAIPRRDNLLKRELTQSEIGLKFWNMYRYEKEAREFAEEPNNRKASILCTMHETVPYKDFHKIKFYYRELWGNWIAIDNTTGDCWVEIFRTEQEAIDYLKEEK